MDLVMGFYKSEPQNSFPVVFCRGLRGGPWIKRRPRSHNSRVHQLIHEFYASDDDTRAAIIVGVFFVNSGFQPVNRTKSIRDLGQFMAGPVFACLNSHQTRVFSSYLHWEKRPISIATLATSV